MRKLTVHIGYALFELRQRDLDALALQNHPYRVGDVLIFKAEEANPLIGAELARAANEYDARAYLETLVTPTATAPLTQGRQLFEQQHEVIQRLHAENSELAAEIAELHTQLNESGKELLITDEERNLASISLDELSSEIAVLKDSLIAIEGRNLSLEAELTLAYAERDFERECDSILETARLGVASASTTEQLPGGGVITINHEFAPLPRKSKASLTYTRLKTAAKIVFVLLVITYVFLTVSLFQTMQASGVPVGEYFDAILNALRALVGLA